MKDNNIHQPINLYRWTKKNESTATLARLFHVLVAVGKETENYGSFLQKAGEEGLRLIGKMQGDGEPAPRHLPDVLATPEAMNLWEVAQREGWVDEQYQPKGTPTQASILAYLIGTRLQLRPFWTPFEKLWGIKNLRSLHNSAINGQMYEKAVERYRKISRA